LAHALSHAAFAVNQTFSRKQIMKTLIVAHVMRAALLGAAFAGANLPAYAEIKNYEFQLVQPTVQAGSDRIVTVRLVDKTTTPMPGTEPGTYRFKANFSMAGRWQLSLGAKVQGETGTVENKLVVTAEK
jgi:hypothetical protein